MAEIVVTEFMDEAAVDTLRARHDTLYDAALVDDRERLLSSLGESRAIIVRNRTQVDAAIIGAAPNLKVIGRLGVGLDNIDVRTARESGVAVEPATGANDLAVAEYVIAATLMLLRGAYLSTARVAVGEWPRGELMGREASGKTMGLVGYGAIAREVAARARAFGMTVVAHDPFLEEADAPLLTLDELLSRADVVSLHVPLTDDTRAMIDAVALARMKSDAVLVNAARGGVVDEAALADALKARRLGGAALDVFAEEPLSADGGRRFEGCPNLVLTPHIAGVTTESNVRVSAVTAENVMKHL